MLQVIGGSLSCPHLTLTYSIRGARITPKLMPCLACPTQKSHRFCKTWTQQVLAAVQGHRASQITQQCKCGKYNNARSQSVCRFYRPLQGCGNRGIAFHDYTRDTYQPEGRPRYWSGAVLEKLGSKNMSYYSERVKVGEKVCLLLQEWRMLVLRNGVSYRRIWDCQRGAVEQLILPEKIQTSVKTALHNDSGRIGFVWTLQIIRERFYWPRIIQEIKALCEQCRRCPLEKLISILSSAHMGLICVDFVSLEKSKGGIENVLIDTDHFSH